MELALIASRETLGGVDDTATLLLAADRAGVVARLVDWRSSEGRDGMGSPDAALLHSPWDYTAHVEEFRAWLRATSEQLPTFNPWSLIESNTHKGYLLKLAAEGVPLPKIELLPAGTRVDVDDLAASFASSPVVVKPAVGSGGRRLERLPSVRALPTSTLLGEHLVPAEDLVVQSFVPSVETGGEYSLIVIGGSSTHLVHKTPATGQYRVQARFGGRVRRVELDAASHQIAESVRPHLAGLAYARVDYVVDERGRPLLMELEATEPDLYLALAPEAAEALISHIRERIPSA